MIALCDIAGISLVRKGLILSAVRTECITLPQQMFTFTSFSECHGLTLPKGKAALTVQGQVQKATVDSARLQCSRDPSPGTSIHATRTPNPRASVSSGTLTSITNLATSLARNMDRLSLDEEHYNRQEEWRRQLPESLGEGLRQGLSRLGLSLLGKGPGRGRGVFRHLPAALLGPGTPGPEPGVVWPFRLPADEAEAETRPAAWSPRRSRCGWQGHPGAGAPPSRALVRVASPASSSLPPRGIPKESFTREGPVRASTGECQPTATCLPEGVTGQPPEALPPLRLRYGNQQLKCLLLFEKHLSHVQMSCKLQ